MRRSPSSPPPPPGLGVAGSVSALCKENVIESINRVLYYGPASATAAATGPGGLGADPRRERGAPWWRKRGGVGVPASGGPRRVTPPRTARLRPGGAAALRRHVGSGGAGAGAARGAGPLPAALRPPPRRRAPAGRGGRAGEARCRRHRPPLPPRRRRRRAGDRLQELLHGLPERAGAAPRPQRLPPVGDLPAGLLPDALPAHRGGLPGLLLPPPPPGRHGRTVTVASPAPLELAPLCPRPGTAPGPWGPVPMPRRAPTAAALLSLPALLSSEGPCAGLAQAWLCPASHREMLCDVDQVTAVRFILRQPSPVWLHFTIEELQIFPPGQKSPQKDFPSWLSQLTPPEQPASLHGELPDPEKVSTEVQQMWVLTEVIRARQAAARIGRFDVDGCYDINLLSYT